MMTEEQGNRWRKVARLIAAIHRTEIPFDALDSTPNGWFHLAAIARVNMPSETTKRLVVSTLEAIPKRS